MTTQYDEIEQQTNTAVAEIQADIDMLESELSGLLNELDVVDTLEKLQAFGEKKAVFMEKQQMYMLKKELKIQQLEQAQIKDQFIPPKENMPYPDMLELDYNRYATIQRLNAEADNFINNQTRAQYPDFEKQTFDIQKSEALAWTVDNTAATPMVDILASNRGVNREMLLQKILEKVQQFELLAVTIAGQRQKYEDQIKTMTDTAAMQELVFTFSTGAQ